jgi:hypothetical protein
MYAQACPDPAPPHILSRKETETFKAGELADEKGKQTLKPNGYLFDPDEDDESDDDEGKTPTDESGIAIAPEACARAALTFLSCSHLLTLVLVWYAGPAGNTPPGALQHKDERDRDFHLDLDASDEDEVHKTKAEDKVAAREDGELALHSISCPAAREREASALAAQKLRDTVVIVLRHRVRAWRY